MASELAEKILEHLSKRGDGVSTLDLAELFVEDHQKVIGAVKSLQTLENVISVEQLNKKSWALTQEGQQVAENGSHEAAVFKAVPDGGVAQTEIMKTVPNAKVGFSKALVAGWIELDKSSGTPIVRRKVPSITDTIQLHLKNVANIPDNVKNDYKKRKLLQEVVTKIMVLSKGLQFVTKIEKLETDLTADLLTNDSWKQKKFKPYNFDALGVALDIGHLHPLLKVRAEFRKIFLEMGFSEMPTNNFVESSFWNFDALFQPQQHPARDAHDTFFISEPRTSSNFPKDYLEKVKKVHSEGGYGSQGYRYEWKIEEAQKNLLRTHTTAVSARMLYNLMQQGEFKPVRYFSIDRVFRNETLDATHLAEFHQVEGVVADYNLTLGDLIGTLYEFFKKLGIIQLEFKPAYNPYTEPSMEIFCFHNGLGKWIEIGNSGIFRPEMLLPMGLPENVNVIAWGLSLERPTMIKYGLNNIRDLVGPKVDLQMVHNNPICRLEKNGPRILKSKYTAEQLEERLDKILLELEQLQKELPRVGRSTTTFEKKNLVIFCDPSRPMYSLETLLSLINEFHSVFVSTYTHSNVAVFPQELRDFCSKFKKSTNADTADITVTIVWKIVGVDPILKLNQNHEIVGEVNIARYLNRFIEAECRNILEYESTSAAYADKIDSALDKIHGIIHGATRHKLDTMQIKSKTGYIIGSKLSIVDIVWNSVKKHHTK
ncbi:phenylalanine--tRNA ligase alpha subunit isoform X1 [Neodiprion lecontei]|uniref:phenylalanine--tRNA ligase n=2 Tax=Neodiprion lecontei TaxID=441921 RepID=A0A6J0BEL7_NEOLC|nr:phenylalanine--tRNA ligase alpha subunit isoform X1 [Neodiprion lecontei]